MDLENTTPVPVATTEAERVAAVCLSGVEARAILRYLTGATASDTLVFADGSVLLITAADDLLPFPSQEAADEHLDRHAETDPKAGMFETYIRLRQSCDSADEAMALTELAAEHLLETWNDDLSIIEAMAIAAPTPKFSPEQKAVLLSALGVYNTLEDDGITALIEAIETDSVFGWHLFRVTGLDDDGAHAYVVSAESGSVDEAMKMAEEAVLEHLGEGSSLTWSEYIGATDKDTFVAIGLLAN